jgi:hypothetical protein
MLLEGVAYPTASVILHFLHRDPYPILDVRALWSVSADAPASERAYGFEFWSAYVDYTRELASQRGVSMRTLDRALWQYAFEHQPSTAGRASDPPS